MAIVSAVTAERVGIPVGTEVFTPSGWRRAEDLRSGDLVMQGDGLSTVVVSTALVGGSAAFDVRMKDGTALAAAAGHPIPVVVGVARDRVDLPVTQVGELVKRGIAVRIAETSPVEVLDSGGRPLAPYLLGVLLAEGSLGGHSPMFWSVEDEIVAQVRSVLPNGARFSPHPDVQARCVGHRLISASGRKKGGNPVTNGLRELGLWPSRSETKFVPDTYLMAPIEDRISLLTALLDCDGAADTEGKVSYSSASPRLAHGVANIVRSLGGRCSERVLEHVHYTVPGSTERHLARPSYVVSAIRLPGVQPFRLSRKAARVRPDSRGRHWSIASVEPATRATLMTIETLNPSQPILVNEFCPIYGTAEALLGARQLLAA